MSLPGRIWAYEESFANQNRKTGWVQSVPTPGICNPVEYTRADLVAAKIERLKARVEFLEKAMTEATRTEPWSTSWNWEYMAEHDPHLYAWLKEKENAN